MNKISRKWTVIFAAALLVASGLFASALYVQAQQKYDYDSVSISAMVDRYIDAIYGDGKADSSDIATDTDALQEADDAEQQGTEAENSIVTITAVATDIKNTKVPVAKVEKETSATEEATTEAVVVETKTKETKVTEIPATETPKAETNVAEAATTETVTTEEPTTEASVTEAATTETAVAEAPSGGSGSATKTDLVNYALQFVGNPYVYGGSSLTNGADCSGFTMAVYQNFGYSLPHSSQSQAGCGTEISVSDVQPGDLLFYSNNGKTIGHVAIYIGNGQIVHASTAKTGITISSYDYKTPWKAVRIMQ